MSEKFKISMLKEEVDAYSEFVEIPVTPMGSDKEHIIKLYPLFSPEKTAKLVDDYNAFLSLCNEEKIKIDESDKGDILGYFIVKFFTDINTTKGKKAKTIKDEIDLLKNSKLYKELMGLFPKESINSVHERIMDVNEAFAQLYSQFEQLQKQYGELDLENRAEIEAVFKNRLNKDDSNEILQ